MLSDKVDEPVIHWVSEWVRERVSQSFSQWVNFWVNESTCQQSVCSTDATCAFKPGCLMSPKWLHTPDCKVSTEMKSCHQTVEWMNVCCADATCRPHKGPCSRVQARQDTAGRPEEEACLLCYPYWFQWWLVSCYVGFCPCFLSGKEKRKTDYAFRRQINEKPSIIPGCPSAFFQLICSDTAACINVEEE